ncbi:uncharacterized protein [Neodiprion pinetum]|uniref:uncharacterized protein n=1 Tax=Neodiprion pinetum TaxID=441929 RepID=UPI001EDF980C|nr:uncharacterized protein LOC124223659 [Neodiprion pinetum]
MTTVQRGSALRIACSYQTFSAQAVLMVAGVIPMDLVAIERKRVYEEDADVTRWDAATTERDTTIQTWQERWTGEPTEYWTRRPIKDLRPWIQRGFGDVNFYVTQLPTGHGYFRRYQHNLK